jgi:hypothetical protein
MKPAGPAHVRLGVSRCFELEQQRRRETTGPVEVTTLEVFLSWAAVTDVDVHVREGREESAGLGGE